MRQSKPFEVRPTQGGRLMSGLSSESAGILNYVEKRDFRRVLDREVRCEGYDKFRPNPIADPTTQSTPPGSDGPICLVTEAFLPNGQRTAVVGTKTTIWRYSGLDNGPYNTDGYNADGYFDSGQGQWIEIARGLSPNGQRWESLQVGSWLVLNNGVDLPITYNLSDSEAHPIYELRENAIASVRTISTIDDVLVCHDIRQLSDDTLTAIMSPVGASVNGFVKGVSSSSPSTGTVNSGLAGVPGSTLTSSDSNFNSGLGFTGLEGRTITMANGLNGVISSVQSPTSCTLDNAPNLSEPLQPFSISSDPSSSTSYQDYAVQPDIDTLFLGTDFAANPDCVTGLNLFWKDGTISQIGGIHTDTTTGLRYYLLTSNQPIEPGGVSIQNPKAYARITDQSIIEPFHGRSIWSLPDDPRRFGAIIPVSVTAGTLRVGLKYPIKSIPQYFGDGGSIEVLGAGSQEGNLTSVISYVNPNITNFVTISDFVSSSNSSTSAQRADTVGSVTGQFQDLDDDGGGILKALALRGYLVIYKTTPNIYIAKFTGDSSQPFVFERIKCADGTQMAYPHTLCNINDLYHVYASESEFYQLDILHRVPSPFEPIQVCKNLFFDQASQDVVLGQNIVPNGAVYGVLGTYTISVPVGYDQQFQISHESGFVEAITPLPSPTLPEMVSGNPPALTDITITGLAGSAVGASIRAVLDQSGTERTFTATNAVTKEFFFCFPSAGSDSCLRFDYIYNTASSSSLSILAGATIRRPTGQGGVTNNEDWFVMGVGTGTVYRYGLMSGGNRPSGTVLVTVSNGMASSSAPFFQSTDVWKSIKTSSGKTFSVSGFISANQVSVLGPGSASGEGFQIIPSVYHRDGLPYTSSIQSGLDSFGSASTEKVLFEYNLILSSQSTGGRVNVGFVSAVNPSDSSPIVQSGILASPSIHNFIQPTTMGNYIADRVDVDGINNPLEISTRSFRFLSIDSHNIGRVS